MHIGVHALDALVPLWLDLIHAFHVRVWQIKKHIVVKLAPHLSPSNLVCLSIYAHIRAFIDIARMPKRW